ncbi:LOW QUALITY PROTEIN: hypothetical protein ACHAW6_008032 [Cyclotella cf. meneghiniana]
MPTPFGPRKAFIKSLYSTVGSIGEAIWDQVPLSYWSDLTNDYMLTRPCSIGGKAGTTQCSTSRIHYFGVKSYVADTLDEGIYFWHTMPHTDLLEYQMPPIHSTPHDIKSANCPVDSAMILSDSMDSGWGSCLLT